MRLHDNYETDRIFSIGFATRYNPDVHSNGYSHILGLAWERNRHPHLINKVRHV